MILEITPDSIGKELKKMLPVLKTFQQENPELANGLRHDDFCCGCGNQSKCDFGKKLAATKERYRCLLKNEDLRRVADWYRKGDGL